MKLIVFDLDGTLAKHNKPIKDTTVEELRHLEKMGFQLVISSGKPSYYTIGMIRQVGLDSPIIIGENGLEILWGVDLPPRKEIVFSLKEEQERFIEETMKSVKRDMLDKVWIQPNMIAMGLFIRDERHRNHIRRYLEKRMLLAPEGMVLYEQWDAFDISTDINKGKGLKALLNVLKIDRKDVVSVGDGENDYSMFRESGVSIGINLKNNDKATHNVNNIEEAMFLVFKYCDLLQ